MLPPLLQRKFTVHVAFCVKKREHLKVNPSFAFPFLLILRFEALSISSYFQLRIVTSTTSLTPTFLRTSSLVCHTFSMVRAYLRCLNSSFVIKPNLPNFRGSYPHQTLLAGLSGSREGDSTTDRSALNKMSTLSILSNNPLQGKFYGDNLSMTNGKNRQIRRQSLLLRWYSRFQNFAYETRPELRL